MSYDEWIEFINIFLNKNDEDIKNKLLNENMNYNLLYMLEPKLIDLIKIKFNNCFINIK